MIPYTVYKWSDINVALSMTVAISWG